MSEHETLELELRSMRPRAASAELRRRVINQLETSAPLQSQRSWSVALAGALAAACLAAVALWRTGDPHAQSNQNGSTANVASAADIADLPTVGGELFRSKVGNIGAQRAFESIGIDLREIKPGESDRLRVEKGRGKLFLRYLGDSAGCLPGQHR
jgi:hypothetical protein